MTPALSVGPRARHFVLALLGLLALGLAQIKWGEILPVGGGQGWDGRTYVGLAQQFPHAVFEEGVDAYRLRRVLPSGLVYLVLTGLDLGREASVARDVFAVLNLAMLALTLLAWIVIVRSLGLGAWSFWLGYVLLFFSFANLKMPFYYSPLTDTTALTLGAWLLACHLRTQPLAALMVLVAGTFTWPSFLVFGAPLCLFRRAALPPAPSEERTGSALGVIVAFLFLLGFLLRARPAEIPIPRWPALGLPISLAYLFLVTRGLFGGVALSRRSTWVGASSWWRVAGLFGVGVAVVIVIRLAARGQGFETSYFLDHAIGYALAKPGLFLISHAVYFGVIVPLGLILWPRVCAAAHGLGAGVTLYLAAHLLWGIHPESREIIDGLPAIVLVVVLAARTMRWPAGGVWGVGALGLAASKVWFVINRDGFQGRSDPFTYPAQHYFMNHGPWMNDQTYLLQGSVALLVTVGLYLWLRPSRAPAEPVVEPTMSLPRPILRASARLAGLLVLVVGVEALARLAVAVRTRQERGEVSAPDPLFGWRNEPGAKRVRGSGYEGEVRFNSHGLRGPEVEYGKSAGVRRVLLLGGSQVEGYNVPEEATTRAVLENSLNRGEYRVEILNGGVAGYATDQAYLAFTSEGHRYEPDDVVLFVSAEDAYLNTTAYGGKPRLEVHSDGSVSGPGPFQPVALPRRGSRGDSTLRFRGSVALRLLSTWTGEGHPAWHRRLATLGLVDRTEPPAMLSAYGARGERDRVWQQLRGILQAFKARIPEAQRLRVVYVPAPFEIDDALWSAYADRYDLSQRPWDRDKVADRLSAICARLEIPFLDPRPALRGRFEAGAHPYVRDEPLWSAAGHAAVAEELARFIRQPPESGALIVPGQPRGERRR